MSARSWITLLKIGDWVLLVLIWTAIIISGRMYFKQSEAQQVVIFQANRVYARLPLDKERLLKVSGPIGITVIEIQPGKARVLSDPGRQQYCVSQGWLSRSPSIAICAPNRVSLELTSGPRPFDSLAY